MAWFRVLYTILGAVIAFGVGALVWPMRARVGLGEKLASIIEGSGRLYRAVAAAALEGVDNDEEIRQLNHRLHDLRRGITGQMDEARSELAFSHFNQAAYSRFVDAEDLLRRRLSAMAEDRMLYMHARVEPVLVPSLPKVAEATADLFAAIAHALRARASKVDSSELDRALGDLDRDLRKLRTERATAPFALDRMLPFWALVFNLREVADDLKQLQTVLPQVA